MTTRIGTLNEQKDLPDSIAATDLAGWLASDRPDLAGLNEWTPDRNAYLRADGTQDSEPEGRRAGEKWARILRERGVGPDYGWTRPDDGGPVALYRTARFALDRCYGHELVGEQNVGDLDGRKSVLPPSIATVAKFADLETGAKVALVVVHLTAEVQDRFGDYHDDAAHLLRVRRHKKERRRLRRLVRKLRRRGYTTWVVGDLNFERCPLPPLISCWNGKPHRGTLGGRAVDYVYAEQDAGAVRVWDGHSDHKGIVAIYP